MPVWLIPLHLDPAPPPAQEGNDESRWCGHGMGTIQQQSTELYRNTATPMRAMAALLDFFDNDGTLRIITHLAAPASVRLFVFGILDEVFQLIEARTFC